MLKLKLSTLLAVALFGTGCGTGSDTATGSFEVRLHDAPAQYDEVNVFIERVEVNRKEDEEGWIVISEPNQSYDLLKLMNGAYEVLGDAELETGTYHQIRLILSSDGHSVVTGGEESSMFIPSGEQTGIKLEVNAEVTEDVRYVLLLDFDASRSVVKTGQSPTPGYILKPVIRATHEAVTGNIEGTLSPAEAAVYAIDGLDTLSTTYPEAETGFFRLTGLEAGTYTVSADPVSETFQSRDTTGVEVTLGETSELGTIELSQN